MTLWTHIMPPLPQCINNSVTLHYTLHSHLPVHGPLGEPLSYTLVYMSPQDTHYAPTSLLYQ